MGLRVVNQIQELIHFNNPLLSPSIQTVPHKTVPHKCYMKFINATVFLRQSETTRVGILQENLVKTGKLSSLNYIYISPF